MAKYCIGNPKPEPGMPKMAPTLSIAQRDLLLIAWRQQRACIQNTYRVLQNLTLGPIS
jgi:hypothetical protein